MEQGFAAVQNQGSVNTGTFDVTLVPGVGLSKSNVFVSCYKCIGVAT